MSDFYGELSDPLHFVAKADLKRRRLRRWRFLKEAWIKSRVERSDIEKGARRGMCDKLASGRLKL